ncbi:sensor histidine kinase [Mucilaginibacter pedocola]|uniref:histidine kinase n=1 Tax=Mucilaginibacter pedocola TaxID=1792845 RepID=A0A1S9P6W0_9SPHI|nr:HAMP domain-containing sensor histidine kinase [Mucilaginibacter pedocola]OOQ56690.1 hypothetical protein BC343_16975 [Mucilaginibacter pedocola]
MKLTSHYNKVSILITVSVLLTGAVIYYFAISSIASGMLDEHLSEEVSELISFVNVEQKLPAASNFDDDQTEFLKSINRHTPTRFFDTIYHVPQKIGYKAGRAVEGELFLKGDSYKFVIIISREGAEGLVQVITTITLLLAVVLLGILFLANRYFINGLWQPFYSILNQLKAFDITRSGNYGRAKTAVNEFTELDGAVEAMVERAQNEYENLKKFTEDASHEMMTPLAVIRSKLDTLIQDDTLQKEHLDQINDIYSATSKLSRLKHALLLLVKIEHNLVPDVEDIELDQLVADKMVQFQELMRAKDLVIDKNLSLKKIKTSKYLMDILLNNLFSNAIRHNINGGTISIWLNAQELKIQNTGSANQLDSSAIFNRFRKGRLSEGTGLGLTIAKNICALYNWNLGYEFTDGTHNFLIHF